MLMNVNVTYAQYTTRIVTTLLHQKSGHWSQQRLNDNHMISSRHTSLDLDTLAYAVYTAMKKFGWMN